MQEEKGERDELKKGREGRKEGMVVRLPREKREKEKNGLISLQEGNGGRKWMMKGRKGVRREGMVARLPREREE